MSDPLSIRCPACEARLTLKSRNQQGRKISCPKCGKPFVVPAPKTTEDEDDALFFQLEGQDSATDEPERRLPPPRRSTGSGGKKSARSARPAWLVPGLIGGGVLAAIGIVMAIVLSGGWLRNKSAGDGGQAANAGGAATAPSSPAPVTIAEAEPPSRQEVKGKWTDADEWILSPTDPVAVLQLAERPPEEYVVSLRARRLTGKNTFAIGLPVPGGQVVLALETNAGTVSGLELVDGKRVGEIESSHRGRLLPPDRETVITCTVRKDAVTCTCGDVKVVDWKGDFRKLSLPSDFAVPDKKAVFLATMGSSVAVREIKVTPSGSTGSVPPAVASTSASEDANRIRTRKHLRLVGQALSQYMLSSGKLPDSAWKRDGDKALLSWRVAVLPWLGRDANALYLQFHLNEPWDSPHNRQFLERMPAVFQSGSGKLNSGKTTLLAVIAPGSAFAEHQGTRRGTFLAGDAPFVIDAADELAVEWSKPGDYAFDQAQPLKGIFGSYSDGFCVVTTDGTDRFVRRNMNGSDMAQLYRMREPGSTLANVFTRADDGLKVVEELGGARKTLTTAAADVDAAKARETSRANVHDIAFGIDASNPDLLGREDPTIRDSAGAALLSWRVGILPHIGEEELFQQFRLNEPWDSEQNRRLIERMPKLYRPPFEQVPAGMTTYLAVTGPNTLMPYGQWYDKNRDSVVDNYSLIVRFVEADPAFAVPWSAPVDLPFDFATRWRGLGGMHDGGFFAATANGFVRFVKADAPWESVAALMGRNDTDPRASDVFQFDPAPRDPRDDDDIENVMARVEAKMKEQFPNLTAEQRAKGLAAARDAATRTVNRNNLLQISLALSTYENANRRLPDARGVAGNAHLSWRVSLLPYLGVHEGELYEQFHLEEPWDSPHNQRLLQYMPAVFKNPARDGKQETTTYLLLTGPGTLYEDGTGKDISQMPEKPENTVLIVDVADQLAVPWTKPEDYVFDPAHPRKGLSGRFADGCFILLADGSPHLLKANATTDAVKALFQYADGKPIPRGILVDK